MPEQAWYLLYIKVTLRPDSSIVAERFVLQVTIMAMSANRGTAKTASRWPNSNSQEQIHLRDECVNIRSYIR